MREACEHAAGTPALHGRAAYSLPLSRLAGHADWLRREARPLVFFCRSGKRSATAVRLAQALGHPHVRHLAGGLALFGRGFRTLIPDADYERRPPPIRGGREPSVRYRTVSSSMSF